MISQLRQSGFTLMEVLIVVGIFGILAALGLWFSMDFFRTYTLGSEEINVVSVLSKARARSLSNVNENQHGVRITDTQYILFQGGPNLSWANRDQTLDEPVPVGSGVDADNVDIIFNQLSGTSACSPECEINLSGLGNAGKTVTINEQGAILW